MTTTERLLQFVEYKGISKYEFHKKNGLSNGFLDKSRAIGTDKCARILENYPEINPEWLITGEGEMIRGVKKDKSVETDLNKDIAKALQTHDKEDFFKLVLAKYYKDTPERFKDFASELSDQRNYIENIVPFKAGLLAISLQTDEEGKLYEYIKNNFSGYIEQTKKILKYLDIPLEDMYKILEEGLNDENKATR